TLIASEKLDPPNAAATPKQINRYLVTRRRFYRSLREATAHLQAATLNTLMKLKPRIQEYQDLALVFGERFHGWTFDSHSLSIRGKPEGPDETRAHDKAAAKIRKELTKAPHIARLALDGLSAFQMRTGAGEENLDELFSIETANLILARIL